jgi:hypothetical protein
MLNAASYLIFPPPEIYPVADLPFLTNQEHQILFLVASLFFSFPTLFLTIVFLFFSHAYKYKCLISYSINLSLLLIFPVSLSLQRR